MNIIDITNQFKDNSQKVQKKIIFHWTASSTAKSAIDWLDQRANGEGSVGYNYIIDKDGSIYMLGNPEQRWFHNTGLGISFDKDTISISLVSRGKKDLFTDKQIANVRHLISILKNLYRIVEINHHAALNKNKPDFPEYIWKEFKKQVC